MPGFNGRGPGKRRALIGRGRGYCWLPFTRSQAVQRPTVISNVTPVQGVLPVGGLLRRGRFSGGGFGRRGSRG